MKRVAVLGIAVGVLSFGLWFTCELLDFDVSPLSFVGLFVGLFALFSTVDFLNHKFSNIWIESTLNAAAILIGTWAVVEIGEFHYSAGQ